MLGSAIGLTLVVSAVAMPANADPLADGLLSESDAALIEDIAGAPTVEPLPEQPTPSAVSATDYIVGMQDTACTAGTDPTGIVTVEDIGGGIRDVTIDLEAVPATETSVFIPSEIALSCRARIHRVDFIGSPNVTELTLDSDVFRQHTDDNNLVTVVFPEGVEVLTLGDRAFQQYLFKSTLSGRYGDNALKEIVFPSTLKTLDIGIETFTQSRTIQTNGNNSLETVSFPEGLESLRIASHAFYQGSGNLAADKNTLAEVNFPSTLKTLEIGERAFSQWAKGGENALEEVIFPEGLERLVLKKEAFYQTYPDQTKLRHVVFPSTLKNTTIGDKVFIATSQPMLMEFRTAEAPGSGPDSIDMGEYIAMSNAQWMWYGASDTSAELWADELAAGSKSYSFEGYRQLDLELDGGTITEMNGSTSRFAYREAEGPAALFGGVPGYAGVTPAWPVLGRHMLTLPEPTKTEHTFLGWCESQPGAAGCSTDVLAAGDELELVDDSGEPTVMYAVWQAPLGLTGVVPTAPRLTTVACDVEPAAVIPNDTGVTYRQTRTGNSLRIDAEAQSGYELVAGSVATWTFDLTPVPCGGAEVPPLAETGADAWLPFAAFGLLAAASLVLLARPRESPASSASPEAA